MKIYPVFFFKIEFHNNIDPEDAIEDLLYFEEISFLKVFATLILICI